MLENPEAMVHFVTAVAAIPKIADQSKGHIGHDTVFGMDKLLIVSDGVGGWKRSGVDPGKASRKIVGKCVDWACTADLSSVVPLSRQITPVLSSIDFTGCGSATLAMALLDNKVLKCINVGDAVMKVLRFVDDEEEEDEDARGGKWTVVYTVPCSCVMIQQWNGKVVSGPAQIGMGCSDTGLRYLSKAEEATVDVCVGDIVLVGSDGISHDLNEHDLVEVFAAVLPRKFTGKHPGPELYTCALSIATAAVKASLHKRPPHDDISVVLGCVVDD